MMKAKSKKENIKPKSFWAIVDSQGKYRYGYWKGIPELYAKKFEAAGQNIGVLNGDQVVKVTLYRQINNFRRR